MPDFAKMIYQNPVARDECLPQRQITVEATEDHGKRFVTLSIGDVRQSFKDRIGSGESGLQFGHMGHTDLDIKRLDAYLALLKMARDWLADETEEEPES